MATKGSSPRKPRQKKTVEPAVPVQPAPSVPTLQQKTVRWLFRPRQLMVLSVIAVLWVLFPVISRHVPQLADRPEYQVGPEQITVNSPPRWIPNDLVAQVFERAGFQPSESLLDETLSERVAAAFYTHPWIENVRSVRKSFPAHLYVDVIWREPVAMVRGVDGYYPVDRHAVLLPPQDFQLEDIQQYPLIERVSSVPVGRPGQPWGDPAVAGAAQLADLLNHKSADTESWWEKLQLSSILVPRRVALSDQQDELEYHLLTKGGSEIVWGRAPSTRHPGEITVAQKLQRLKEYQRDYGGFDDSHGPWHIDIRPWHGIGRGLLVREKSAQTSLR